LICHDLINYIGSGSNTKYYLSTFLETQSTQKCGIIEKGYHIPTTYIIYEIVKIVVSQSRAFNYNLIILYLSPVTCVIFIYTIHIDYRSEVCTLYFIRLYCSHKSKQDNFRYYTTLFLYIKDQCKTINIIYRYKKSIFTKYDFMEFYPVFA